MCSFSLHPLTVWCEVVQSFGTLLRWGGWRGGCLWGLGAAPEERSRFQEGRSHHCWCTAAVGLHGLGQLIKAKMLQLK